MTRSPLVHLLDILAEVPDPRHKKGKRHPLLAVKLIWGEIGTLNSPVY